MCGIVGYKKFSSNSQNFSLSLKIATDSLSLRGPDFQSTLVLGNLGFGHARLSIIDTSDNANQPMQDPSGRFTLIFNGEIYNYKQLKSQIHRVSWRSTSDTEVLLHLLIQKGTSCLEELNGFFAFAFYDSHTDRLVIARDRMGIKPLHYFQNNDFLVFGSEMKALMQFPIPREIDHKSLNWYLKLTYLPRDHSMLSGVKKLLPGHYLEFDKNRSTVKSYESPDQEKTFHGSFESAKSNTLKLLQKSVERRMVADVPLGAFLSGGTDSSAVVAMASKFDSNLNTFSIGYRDHPFFDETQYAELVAQKFKTNHTTFSLTNDDLLNSIEDSIGYLDEPFGDSSAIPTFILSKMVSTSMKVALSGDGADELFGGYYKHLAFVKAHQATIGNSILKKLARLSSLLPNSRNSQSGNFGRRLTKYIQLLKLNKNQQYWRLASFYEDVDQLVLQPTKMNIQEQKVLPNDLTDLNSFLDADLKIVLPGDMLTKVDLMSMSNSLEVRVPFLDKDLVTFARSLPVEHKISGNQRKKVLQDAFENILPKELHHRSKKGFEVPVLHWLKNDLYSDLEATLFQSDFMIDQGLFNIKTIQKLEKKLFSKDPGDVHSILWSLYIFQKWYKKYFLNL